MQKSKPWKFSPPSRVCLTKTSSYLSVFLPSLTENEKGNVDFSIPSSHPLGFKASMLNESPLGVRIHSMIMIIGSPKMVAWKETIANT